MQDVHNLRLFDVTENDSTPGPNRPLEMPIKSNYQTAHRIAPTFVFPVWKTLLNSLFSHIHACLQACRHIHTSLRYHHCGLELHVINSIKSFLFSWVLP